MLTFSSRTSPLHVMLLASAFGIGLAASASAQDFYSHAAPVTYNNAADEEITVSAPRRHTLYRGEANLPTERVSSSQPVRYDDLDLTTPRGVRILHERIAAMAHHICNDLNGAYPDAADLTCYATTVDNTEPLAVAAIDRAHARSGTY